LLDCYDETGCGLDVDPYVCLCGTFTGTDCAGGEADGVCLAQARSASLNATVFATLLRFTNPDYPVGDASLLYDCAKTNCRACL
jgi:hypothetical protein